MSGNPGSRDDPADPVAEVVAAWYQRDSVGGVAAPDDIMARIAVRRRRARGARRRGAFVAGLAAACALFGGWLTLRRRGEAVESIAAQRSPVRFVYVATGQVSHVALVGDFNGWNPRATLLTRAHAGGQWVAEVPVSVGPHAYAFVLDGDRWTTDPAAPLGPDDGLGATSIVVVEPRHRQR